MAILTSPPLLPLPVGLSALFSGHLLWIPELPPPYLSVCVSQRARRPTSLETQGRLSPSACWTAGGADCLAQPSHLSGICLNVLD